MNPGLSTNHLWAEARPVSETVAAVLSRDHDGTRYDSKEPLILRLAMAVRPDEVSDHRIHVGAHEPMVESCAHHCHEVLGHVNL